MITENIQVIHSFDEKERGDFAVEQANLLDEREQLDKQLTQAKKQFAASIAEKDAQIRALSLRIRTGTEMRSVRCFMIDHRPDVGYRIVVRTDNGHVWKRRKLEPEERQMKLIVGSVSYVAIAELEIDAKEWELSSVEIPIFEDELIELGTIEPKVKIRGILPALQAPEKAPEPPVQTAERVVSAECPWCAAGDPFDENLPNSHIVTMPDKSEKRRTCKNKDRKS